MPLTGVSVGSGAEATVPVAVAFVGSGMKTELVAFTGRTSRTVALYGAVTLLEEVGSVSAVLVAVALSGSGNGFV